MEALARSPFSLSRKTVGVVTFERQERLQSGPRFRIVLCAVEGGAGGTIARSSSTRNHRELLCSLVYLDNVCFFFLNNEHFLPS